MDWFFFGMAAGMAVCILVSRLLERLAVSRATATAEISGSTLCDVCLERARAGRFSVVFVYPTGHILAPQSEQPQSIAAWPATDQTVTFCGLDIGGMGISRLYRLDAAFADQQAASR